MDMAVAINSMLVGALGFGLEKFLPRKRLANLRPQGLVLGIPAVEAIGASRALATFPGTRFWLWGFD